jgi:hypothetical protein
MNADASLSCRPNATQDVKNGKVGPTFCSELPYPTFKNGLVSRGLGRLDS